ncbi:remorin 1.4-like [Neltuma alba]|uniref:remorin 1.4-like n=1 Tax=Neltuma alba TaxID=207710 RepID=UPI0010A57E47|nr:remorin 1.4-like [Prosopis alba]
MEQGEASKSYKTVPDSAVASTSEPRQDANKDSEKADSASNDVVVNQKLTLVATDFQNLGVDKHLETSTDRDVAFARVESEKRLAFVRAWEESEKAKVENKASKKISMIGLWEDRKKAAVQVQIKTMEEGLEKKKADYVEKMKNKMAEIHQLAEEEKAVIEAKKYEDFLKVEENAAKYRSRGYSPRKFSLFPCFKVHLS